MITNQKFNWLNYTLAIIISITSTDTLCKMFKSQNVINIINRENYNKFKIKCEKIEKEQEKKKKVQTPEKLQKELERLNLLFQKGRIEWDYYSKEYDRIENELNELLNVAPELEPDYAYLEDLLNTDFRTMYYNLTQENRRAFWHSIIREIHLNTDHTVDSVDFL